MLEQITNLLPERARPFAKYMLPSIIGLLGTLVYAAINWQLDAPQLEVGMTSLLTTFVAFSVSNGSEGWKRFAKAISASFTALGVVLIHSLVVWDWDVTSTRTAISGLVTAFLVFLLPNADLFIPHAKAGTPPDLNAAAEPVVPPGLQP